MLQNLHITRQYKSSATSLHYSTVYHGHTEISYSTSMVTALKYRTMREKEGKHTKLMKVWNDR